LKNVKLATRAALSLAKKLRIKSVAFPGMETGVGGIKTKDAAKIIVEEF
jgi:O-acetyl-ADP-ribose deacetylase (regulator of RNase III)